MERRASPPNLVSTQLTPAEPVPSESNFSIPVYVSIPVYFLLRGFMLL